MPKAIITKSLVQKYCCGLCDYKAMSDKILKLHFKYSHPEVDTNRMEYKEKGKSCCFCGLILMDCKCFKSHSTKKKLNK